MYGVHIHFLGVISWTVEAKFYSPNELSSGNMVEPMSASCASSRGGEVC